VTATSILVTDVTTASNHTCAKLSNGKLKCWGGNGGGQLGYKDIFPSNFGDDPGEFPSTLDFLPFS
jgi:hypothetical protein